MLVKPYFNGGVWSDTKHMSKHFSKLAVKLAQLTYLQ